MAKPVTRKDELREFILAQVRQHPTDIARLAMDKFKLSRQWVTRVLAELVDQGVLKREGVTRDVKYVLTAQVNHYHFKVMPSVAEHDIWDQFARKCLSDLPHNVLEICHYGLTEMVNNIIDHSESKIGDIRIAKSPDLVELHIWDRGIGIFTKIKRALGLDNMSDAVFELSKGKFTTDPARHSGEGVFFTSRVFDAFSIMSSEMYFSHSRDSNDWLLEDRDQHVAGTSIFMSINPTSTHTLEEVFEHYATERDDYGFNRTRLVLKLAEHADGPLIARSQAKRVTARLYRFKEVIFDFTGVETIGPAFADEVFRVYHLAHPDIEIIPVNTNERTARMVSRALRAARDYQVEQQSGRPKEPTAE